jgi:F420-dependent oxidoreductase-like protein
MARIGIMIEGQEDLNWDRLFRLADAVEELGFEALFSSDHLTSVKGFASRASLALWPSLTALALRTKRIRFGPMVCSMTFRHPAVLAKMAACVDVLSGGRLDLGLGAGWYKGEHSMFGIALPPHEKRMEMLEEGVQVIKALWSGRPANFAGKHYRLEAAESYPLPIQSQPTIIIGGRGEKVLKLIAKHATEWNCYFVGIEVFRQKSRWLDAFCAEIGRDPTTLRRSLMTPFVVGEDEATVQRRIDAHRTVFPDLPPTITDWHAAGFIGGSPQQLVDQLKAFEEAGVERFMLQHNDLDDLESLALLANQVLPHLD